MAEVVQRESARVDDERREKRGQGGKTEEGMRWQMQIQEDVSNERKCLKNAVHLHPSGDFGQLQTDTSHFMPFSNLYVTVENQRGDNA